MVLRKQRRSYPPRPTRPGMAEASLDWKLIAVVGALGAKRVLGPWIRSRLEMAGIPRVEMDPILDRVWSVSDWAREWMRYAELKEAAGDYHKAAAAAYLGQLILSVHQPCKHWFIETMQRCHYRERQARPDLCVERVSLVGGRLLGIWERPIRVTAPPVLMFPPLACTKEELTTLADPLLAQGHPVLRVDLPGQGESHGPLRPDSETQLLAILEEMEFEQVFLGGISLGAYYGLRMAATAPERVLGLFGISPPAILTAEDWARQMEIIWQYLDRYFGAETREETYRFALQMHLKELGERVKCPVLLYHGTQDRINSPLARELYRDSLPNSSVTDFLLPDTHACPYHLRLRVAPEVARWVKGLSPA